MIVADTSVIIDFLKGARSQECEALDRYLEAEQVWIAPVVETELLSDPNPSEAVYNFLEKALQLEIHEGYWERAGKNRAKLKAHKLKAKTADALIAQSCIDHNAPLLTRDADFKPYAKYCGLKLVKY